MTFADELEDLLQREKDLILKGLISSLPTLTARKTHLFHALRRDSKPSPEQLNALRSAASQNAALLAAAGRGLKAAIKQVSDAQTQKDQSFYGPGGERKSLIARAEKLEQKI